MTARNGLTPWPAMEEGRYYASWLIGLAAVGVVLLLASDREALHVLATAVELILAWTFAVGFSLLLI